MGTFYTRSNEKQQVDKDYDHYYAQILHKFGDADELARQHRANAPDYRQPALLQQSRSEERAKNEVRLREKELFFCCTIFLA